MSTTYDLACLILDDTLTKGGSTRRFTGTTPTRGYTVGDGKAERRIGGFHEHSLNHLRRTIHTYIDEHDHALYYGAWVDQDTGILYLDTPHLYDDFETAILAAVVRGEVAIYSLHEGKEYRTADYEITVRRR